MKKSSVKANIFAKRLQEMLDYRGLNCNQLSKISGVSRSNISRYLQMTYAPKVENAMRISEALNVDFEWLIGTSEIKFDQIKVEEEAKKKLEKELLTDNYIFVGDLTEPQKRLMKQLVNQYRKK